MVLSNFIAARIRLMPSSWRETRGVSWPESTTSWPRSVPEQWGLQENLSAGVGSPDSLPRSREIHVDGGVLAFSVIVPAATSVLFGLLPALKGSRVDLADALRAGRATTSGGPRRLRRGPADAFFPASQIRYEENMGLLVRSAIPADKLTPMVRAELEAIDPQQPPGTEDFRALSRLIK